MQWYIFWIVKIKGCDILKVFVGRQPILDLSGNIYAYELLYRNSEENIFPGVNPEEATIELLVNTFLSIGVDAISGKGLSFINFSEKLLAQNVFDSLDPERVVIEILEDVEITPALLTRLRGLKDDGFRLALDDFILQEDDLHNKKIFEIVDYIKIDFLESSPAERRAVENLKNDYPHIRLLAEKVETAEQYNAAKEVGYELFQGYFFAKPEIMEGYEIPSNMNLHFQIIKQINSEQPSITQISELIMRDVSLSYKMLRFINSPAVDVVTKVSSIKQALVLVGLKEMKKWLHVLAMRELNNEEDGRVQALIDYSLTRAKLCELLAKREGKDNPDEYFLAGMFSLMNIIMKSKWEDILPLIPVSDLVADSLKGVRTNITPYLEIAEAIERFDLSRLEILTVAYGIRYEELSDICTEANRWSQTLE